MKAIFLLSILAACVTWPFLCGADEYWVSYQRIEAPVRLAPAGPKYLLKIDALGNILVPPTLVVPNSRFRNSPRSSISIYRDGSSRVILWLPGFKRGVAFHSFFRAVINETTLQLSAIHGTLAFTLDPSHAQVTQKGQSDFLLAAHNSSSGLREYWAYGISPTGTLLGETWLLSQRPTTCVVDECGAGVSSDGRILFYTASRSHSMKQEVVLQRLGPRGRPVGSPVVVEELRNISPLDVTNRLPGAVRYVLYDGSTGNPNTAGIFMQVIDDSAFKKVGNKIKIPAAASLAVDPQGRFLVYCGGLLDPVLYFQALDATGHASGSPKILARNVGEGGVDILRIRNQ